MSLEKTEMLVPDRILQLLEVEGIDTLFGIPDPCFVPLFTLAERRGWRVVAPHHEQAGGFMADGLYRLTGKPGVVIGNEGPGVANLAPAAIAAAAVESAPEGPPIHPAHMAREIARAMPEDPVIIRDGGAVSLWGMAFGGINSSDVHWSQNFGHLGTGIPHAIGAQLAVGDSRRVVLVSGDSAFQFHISELETAVRKKLPIVFIVGCDYAWGLEVKVYNMAFGEEASYTEARWGDQVRFDKIAEGYGAHGEFVERREEIGPAIERALACGRPAVVQIPLDPEITSLEVPAFEEFATWYGDKGYE